MSCSAFTNPPMGLFIHLINSILVRGTTGPTHRARRGQMTVYTSTSACAPNLGVQEIIPLWASVPRHPGWSRMSVSACGKRRYRMNLFNANKRNFGSPVSRLCLEATSTSKVVIFPRTWWHMPLIPALGKAEISLGYTVNIYLKRK